MNFLLILVFVFPSAAGGPPIEVEARRVAVRLSSPQACALYGAEQARRLAQETRPPVRVTFRCEALPSHETPNTPDTSASARGAIQP